MRQLQIPFMQRLRSLLQFSDSSMIQQNIICGLQACAARRLSGNDGTSLFERCAISLHESLQLNGFVHIDD